MRLDTDIQVDPYSWAMARIVGTLGKIDQFGREGSMSDHEWATLEHIRNIIKDRDREALNMPTPRAIVLRS